MAYWPTSGHTLDSINYSRCSVGIIQFFVSNTVKFQEDSTSSRVQEHLFCFVEWKQSHPQYDWFGQSAIVSSTHN